MSLVISVPPVSEPITAEEQMSWSRVTDSAEAADIEALITGAREHCEHWMQRAIMTQTCVERFEHFPCEFHLQRAPVQSITSVQYVDLAGATQTVSSSNYYTDLFSTPAEIEPAIGYTWPATFMRPNAVIVTYVAGWESADDVPRAIKMAISMLVDHWYENRGAFIAGAGMSELPMGVCSLLQPWRVYHEC